TADDVLGVSVCTRPHERSTSPSAAKACTQSFLLRAPPPPTPPEHIITADDARATRSAARASNLVPSARSAAILFAWRSDRGPCQGVTGPATAPRDDQGQGKGTA